MTQGTTLEAVQLQMKCSHVRVLGEPCDYGGHAICGCVVIFNKANAVVGEEPLAAVSETGETK